MAECIARPPATKPYDSGARLEPNHHTAPGQWNPGATTLYN